MGPPQSRGRSNYGRPKLSQKGRLLVGLSDHSGECPTLASTSSSWPKDCTREVLLGSRAFCSRTGQLQLSGTVFLPTAGTLYPIAPSHNEILVQFFPEEGHSRLSTTFKIRVSVLHGIRRAFRKVKASKKKRLTRQSITNKLPRVTRNNVIKRLVGGIHRRKVRESKSNDLQQRSNQSRNESNDQATSNRVRDCIVFTGVTTSSGIGWAGRVAGGGTIEGLGKALERGEGLSTTLVTVDGEHHPRTAMAGLTTVSPDGRGVVDSKGPGGEVGGVCGDWEEAGVEPDPLASGLVGQGQARSSE